MTKKKKEPARYEIDSFEKLVNVISRDNFTSLTTDLMLWLGYVVQFLEDVNKTTPKKYLKDKSNWDLCKMTFIWVDDGEDGIKSVVIKNQLTGEVKTFEIKAKL